MKTNTKTQKEIEEIVKRYRNKFANPDIMSSAAQFNPKYAGTLFQDFEQFLETELTHYAEQIQEKERKRIKEKVDEFFKMLFGNAVAVNGKVELTSHEINVYGNVLRQALTASAEQERKGQENE